MDKNRNIIRHAGKVTGEQREKVLGQKGLVVWFTGLSGCDLLEYLSQRAVISEVFCDGVG